MGKKMCVRCGKEKKALAFQKGTSNVCRLCKAIQNEEKGLRFSKKEHNPNIDLSKLKEITVFSKNLSKVFTVSYKDYKKLSERYEFKTIAEGEVYCTEFMDEFKEDILTKTLILERDDFKCQYCGEDGDTVDHIYPQSLGGADHYVNYITSCELCNEAKGDMILENIFQIKEIINSKAQERCLKNRRKREKERQKTHSTPTKTVTWLELRKEERRLQKNKTASLDEIIDRVINKKSKW